MNLIIQYGLLGLVLGLGLGLGFILYCRIWRPLALPYMCPQPRARVNRTAFCGICIITRDAIKVLKDILRTQSEEVEAANTEPIASSDLPGPTTRRPSVQADNEASRPISACSKALETLRKLRQAEQAKKFEPYSRVQGRKRSSSSLSDVLPPLLHSGATNYCTAPLTPLLT